MEGVCSTPSALTGITVSTRLSIIVSTRIIASIDTTNLLFMPKSSHLEVISYRDNAADRTDEYADRKERDEHDHPHLGERNDLHKGYCKALRNLCLQRLIQAPLGKERKAAAGNAEHETLDNKGASNEAVGRADHLHYGDLFSSAVGCERSFPRNLLWYCS